MASLPVEILFGIYLGILTGIIPALIAGVLGFAFKYVTGVSAPGFAVAVLGLAVAGVNGGFLALNDPTVKTSENATAIVVAIIVMLMLAFYAHAQGDKLGDTLPRRVSLKSLASRRLSSEVVELVGERGQVRVRVAGEVTDMEGYPPLPADLRAELSSGEWTFPADIPLSELETRLADRLRSEYDLADVSVQLDERAKASVAAAPPVGALSKRVPAGNRAVSVEALVPTGVARGESVRVVTDDAAVDGTVVSAQTTQPTAPAADPKPATENEDDADDQERPQKRAGAAPVTTGGEGRVTVAVDRSDAETLLGANRAEVVVQSRGVRREYELTSLLRRAGKRLRRVSVNAGGALDGETIGGVSVRDRFGVEILAVRRDGWQFAPRGATELSAGDELFVVGTRDALDGFAEVAA